MNPSEFYLDGHLAGSDDCVSWLDQEDLDHLGGWRAGRAVRTTPNPHPRWTFESSEWQAGYDHGWNETLDRDQQRS